MSKIIPENGIRWIPEILHLQNRYVRLGNKWVHLGNVWHTQNPSKILFPVQKQGFCMFFLRTANRQLPTASVKELLDQAGRG